MRPRELEMLREHRNDLRLDLIPKVTWGRHDDGHVREPASYALEAVNAAIELVEALEWCKENQVRVAWAKSPNTGRMKCALATNEACWYYAETFLEAVEKARGVV